MAGVTQQQLSTLKRNMENAVKAFKKSHDEFDKTCDKVLKGHEKIEGARASRPEQPLNDWNRELQGGNKALNAVAKAMQNLANATNAYHQARLQLERQEAAAS